jgi:hypothetical protein
MRKSYLVVFVFTLLRVIDQGKHTRISLDEVFRLCESRKIIEWLLAEFPDLFRQHLEDQKQNALILDALDRCSNATTASKYGIENSGICLLVDWLVEIADDEAIDSVV